MQEKPKNLLQSLFQTQLSILNHSNLYNSVKRRRIEDLALCGWKDFMSPHPEVNINSLSLDNIDQSYMLTGGYNGCIGIFDFSKYELEGGRSPSTSSVQGNNSVPPSSSFYRKGTVRREIYKPLNLASCQNAMISSLHWYSLDCGIFLSSDMSGRVVVYDTEMFSPACGTAFQQRKVYHARFHPSMQRSTLVACALDDGSVRLWDILSRDSLQTISAHKAAVSTVDWHPYYEHQLLTTGFDCAVRVWDIRKAAVGMRGQNVMNSQAILSLDWRQDHSHKAEKMSSNGLRESFTGQSTHHPRYLHPLQGSASGKGGGSGLGRAHDGPVLSGRYSPCARHIITAGSDSHVRLWSAEDGRYLHNVRYEVSPGLTLPSRMEVSEGQLFLPHIPARSTEQGPAAAEVAVLDVDTGQCVARLSGHLSAAINSVVFRKSTQQVFSVGRDKLLLAYEAPLSAGEEEDKIHVELIDRPNNDSQAANNVQSDNGNSSARRLFVPPIVQQYREEAERARQKRTREALEQEDSVALQNVGSSSSSGRRNREGVDWTKIDELFR